MISNLDRFKKDLDSLLAQGERLSLAIQKECWPEKFDGEIREHFKEKAAEVLKKIPSFTASYQEWYSEAKVLVKQMLPDRLSDFVGHYEKPKSRKSITYETYRFGSARPGIVRQDGILRGDWQSPLFGYRYRFRRADCQSAAD
jgi:hypothetical protein